MDNNNNLSENEIKRNRLLKAIEMKRMRLRLIADKRELDQVTLKPLNLASLVPIYEKAKESESQSYTTSVVISKKQENPVPLKLEIVRDIGCDLFPIKEGSVPKVVAVNIHVEMKPKLNPEKLKILENKEHCHVCKREHSMALLPYFCGSCKHNVCVLCSAPNFQSEILKLQYQRICSSCIPPIKLKLKEKLKDKKHADEAKIEISALPFGNAEFYPLGVIKKLDLNFNQEKACRLCFTPFSFFRPSKKCGNCRNLSCSSCVKVITSVELGIHQPTPICRECILKSKSMRLRGTSHGGSSMNLLKKDINCKLCNKSFSMFRKKKKCEECSTEYCSNCIIPLKSSILPWKSRSVCKSCLPKIKLQLDEFAIRNPKLADKAKKESQKLKLSVSEEPKKPKIKGEINMEPLKVEKTSECHVCTKKFSFFKGSYKCKNCEKDVCRSCSKGKFISSILGLNKVRICKPCLPKLKEQIELKLKEKPELKLEAEKELGELELAIGGKLGNTSSSSSSSSSSSDDENKKKKKGGEIGLGLDINKPKVDVNIKLPKFEKKKKEKERCPICSDKLSKKAKACENCKVNVCESCSIKTKFPSIGLKSSKHICFGCYPLLKMRSHLKEGKKFQLPKQKN